MRLLTENALSALDDGLPTVRLQPGQMRFGAERFELLIVFDGPFGAAANFELLEQLQFAFGFEKMSALLGNLAMKLQGACFERSGAALNVGFEVRESNVVFAGRRRGMPDVSTRVVELRIESTNLLFETLTGGQQVSKMSAFRLGLLAA